MNAKTGEKVVMNCTDYDADIWNIINVTMKINSINIVFKVKDFSLSYFGVNQRLNLSYQKSFGVILIG